MESIEKKVFSSILSLVLVLSLGLVGAVGMSVADPKTAEAGTQQVDGGNGFWEYGTDFWNGWSNLWAHSWWHKSSVVCNGLYKYDEKGPNVWTNAVIGKSGTVYAYWSIYY